MSYLLDTNACIRYLNGRSQNTRLERLTPDDVVLCSVVKAELLYCAVKSTAGERTLARLNQFFSVFRFNCLESEEMLSMCRSRWNLAYRQKK